ncbi:hypothetical protein GCM10009087_08700 [Sphingomonas oligophenolica]
MLKPGIALLMMITASCDAVPAQNSQANPPPNARGPFAATRIGPPGAPLTPGAHVPMPQGDPQSIVIRLERGGCFGSCPDYSVDITGMGTVSYEGLGSVLVRGKHHYKVGADVVQRLAEQFRRADFWSLRDDYSSQITDQSTYKLVVTIGGQTKAVTDYVGGDVGMPASVTELEKAVDAAAGTARWIDGNEETLPSLRREHWSFHSRDAGETLARAASSAPDSVVNGLLDGRAPIDARPTDVFEGAASPLENACRKARLAIARRLIAAGALDTRADARELALFAAVESAHPAMVAEILRLHPRVNARNREGDTPLLWVEEGGHPFYDDEKSTDTPAVIRQLIAAGANPNATDKDSETVLHKTLDVANAREYIKAGAELEARNKSGETPLLATYGEDIALLLLDSGANPDVRNANGLSFVDIAGERHFDKVLKRLKQP